MLLVSDSISSCPLNFIDKFTLSCIICLYVSYFVFELCKRGVGFLTITDVLNVAIIGERSEVKSQLDCTSVYVGEIPLVTKKSS